MDKGFIEIGNIITQGSAEVIRRLKSNLYKLNLMSIVYFDSEEADFLSTLIYGEN